LPAAAGVEAVAALFAGGGVDGAGAAQRGEARLGAEPAGVVAGGDQQRGGGPGAYALFCQEAGWGGVGEERFQPASSWAISAVRAW
jgi:hypothetical protein